MVVCIWVLLLVVVEVPVEQADLEDLLVERASAHPAQSLTCPVMIAVPIR